MDQLYRYRAYTLIDITNTGVTSFAEGKEKARNQQRNWETVYQILSLRAQLLEFKFLNSFETNIESYSFGINYTGIQKIWSFEFAVEHEDIYTMQNDRYATLKDDFKVAPIILGLDETIIPNKPLFYAAGPEKNIYFIAVKPE